MAEEPFKITALQVAQSIGWMDGFGSDPISFDCVDWHTIEEDQRVELEGRRGAYSVHVVVHIEQIEWGYDPEPCDECGAIIGCECAELDEEEARRG